MSPRKLFRDRIDAGERLAARLRPYRAASPIVVGLPRGGVPVAFEVARELAAPLDVCIVRKLGAPFQPELGIGAAAEGGVVYVDQDATELMGISAREVGELATSKQREIQERVRMFRRGRPALDVRDRTVIVVDDGLATGGTARAALQALRARGAGRIVLAVPVAAAESLEAMTSLVDEVVCLHAPERFLAVGLWYDDFRATTDDDVVELLDRAGKEYVAEAAVSRAQPLRGSELHEEVRIPFGDGWLEARLSVPAEAGGLVLFAHGSGSSRHSPRNQYVAGELQRRGLGTLLLDLLTKEEEAVDARTARLRFDIDLLASRLVVATEWSHAREDLAHLPIGYFGASTGAAAALVAAAARPGLVRAVVSRGGRPDLAEPYLGDVQAPTLLIVGGADPEVLQLNRESLYFLASCEKDLQIVPGASHLFEEPGALEHVARLAARWLSEHLDARIIPRESSTELERNAHTSRSA